jgi:uncharacterized protein (DUF697 family)
MTTEFATLPEQEQKTIPSICILAALADGMPTDTERQEIGRIVDKFSNEVFDLHRAFEEARSGRLSADKLAQSVQSEKGKALAYEMAVCICNVDQALTPSEQHFLAGLHRSLGLDFYPTTSFQKSAASLSAASLTEPPVLTQISTQKSEIDEVIVNRSILAGALELMPQTLATMAIVPVQMQLVYQIGKKHGFDLDLTHTKEFLATVGVGLTSQVVEGYLSGLVRSVTGRFAGKLITGLVTQATESALAFATTYAIGHAAKAYYSSGRSLSAGQLRGLFSSMLNQGRAMKSQYTSQIAQQSSKLNITDLLSMAKAA